MNRQDRDFRNKEKYPLLRILEEYLNPANGWPLRKCAVFALAVCVQYDCNQNQKNGFYRLAEKYLQSEEDFFYFVQMQSMKNIELIIKPECNRKGNRNRDGNRKQNGNSTDDSPDAPDSKTNDKTRRIRRGGWGGGMRTLVNRWYKQQDPAALLKSASHLKGRQGWKHSDLFKMAHVPFSAFKEKGSPYEFVIYFIMHGYEKTMNTYANNAEMVPLMRVLEQHHKATLSPKDRCAIIKTFGLKADQVRSDWLTKDTWPALVANMTAQEVVQNMPTLWMIDLDENSKVWKAAAKVLMAADPSDFYLDPTSIYVVKMNYLLAMQFEGKCCFRNKKGKMKVAGKLKAEPQKNDEDLSSDEESKRRKPDVVIVNALNHLLEKTLKKNVVPSEKRLVVAIHLGNSDDERCAFTHSMTAMDAAAWMLLNLRRDYSELIFLVPYFITMKKIVFPATNSMEQILKLFKATPEIFSPTKHKLKIGDPIEWAINFCGPDFEVDAFVVITPSLHDWSERDEATHLNFLEEFHSLQRGKQKAKLAVCVLTKVFGDRAQPPRSPHTMEFTGFDAHTLFMLNKFISGAFDDKEVLSKSSYKNKSSLLSTTQVTSP
ncbi:RNA-binding protein RO60-like [Cloeon dipterum]|uniref:RNA-binding protein RO60-like n=1 Tax=Cloeon dipterum TaxID=197152 RepID=UPI003220510C